MKMWSDPDESYNHNKSLSLKIQEAKGREEAGWGDVIRKKWPEKLVWSDRTPDKAGSDSALPRWRASGVSTCNAENMTTSTRHEKLGESSANKNYGTAFGRKNCSGRL